MIKKIDNVFKLDSKNTSYIIRISKYGHILNDYYGAKIIDDEDFLFSKEKYSTPAGTAVSFAHFTERLPSTSISFLRSPAAESGRLALNEFEQTSSHKSADLWAGEYFVGFISKRSTFMPLFAI